MNKSPKNMTIEELTSTIQYLKDLKAQRIAEKQSLVDAMEELEEAINDTIEK
ncbi:MULTISPECIES: hypothetical protein [Rhodococcus]|uniref:hypothetical protein n=1 Tax=Rhodococcus TaxID=1827 RepID=UPI0013158C90|nr:MULTISPECIES: hypothetical protein [Rhodococcus]MCC4303983.1 hypothetical protein [Rhodococcus sp. 3-2]